MSRKKQVNQKITALYCRISLDDGGDNESMSISNQKLMLRDFAEKNGMFSATKATRFFKKIHKVRFTGQTVVYRFL